MFLVLEYTFVNDAARQNAFNKPNTYVCILTVSLRKVANSVYGAKPQGRS